jgi:hypothetical protein
LRGLLLALSEECRGLLLSAEHGRVDRTGAAARAPSIRVQRRQALVSEHLSVLLRIEVQDAVDDALLLLEHLLLVVPRGVGLRGVVGVRVAVSLDDLVHTMTSLRVGSSEVIADGLALVLVDVQPGLPVVDVVPLGRFEVQARVRLPLARFHERRLGEHHRFTWARVNRRPLLGSFVDAIARRIDTEPALCRGRARYEAS